MAPDHLLTTSQPSAPGSGGLAVALTFLTFPFPFSTSVGEGKGRLWSVTFLWCELCHVPTHEEISTRVFLPSVICGREARSPWCPQEDGSAVELAVLS